MTLQELAQTPGVTVGTKEASEILGVSRYGLTLAAREGRLGLRYVFSGNRLKISKADLLAYCGWKSEESAEAAGGRKLIAAKADDLW